MQFNYIQSFRVDSTKVGKAPYVHLTSVELFFKEKPQSVNNTSGIKNPGITINLCPFKDDTPKYDSVIQNEYASADWSQVSALSDASTSTKFHFNTPIILETDKYFGIVIRFEDDDYKLWAAVQDEFILGSTAKYSGTSNDGDGKLYISSNDNALGVRPLADRDLKFNINIKKFTSNTALLVLTNDDYEFFSVDTMSNIPKFKGGETIFQPFGNSSSNTSFSGQGTATVTLGNYQITGSNTVFLSDYNIDDNILITSSDYSNQQVAKITSVTDDSTIVVDESLNFTASGCYHKKIPAAKIFEANYVNNEIICNQSTAANSTFRFYTNSVYYFTNSTGGAVFGGSGYSNNDVVRVSNTAAGGINCIANVNTNTSGGITSLRITTPGSGFNGSSNAVVAVLQSDLVTLSSGSGASIKIVQGAPLKGETSLATASLTSINNYEVSVVDPDIKLSNSSTSYGQSNIAFSNSSYAIQTPTVSKFNDPVDLDAYRAYVASRSNEVKNSTNLYNTDKSNYVTVSIGVNADPTATPLFHAPLLNEDDMDVFCFTNSVSPTNSNLDSEVGVTGNTLAKHITKRITFANNSFAEDIRVYINAYKPAGTDLKVYARIHNSNDIEAFDDKNWSLLEAKDNASRVSAQGNKGDIIEYTYGFYSWPTVNNTITTGTITGTLNSNTLATSVDLSSSIAANDLIRIYNPLFSNTNYMVVPVTAVSSSTISLARPISNTGIATSTGSTVGVDKLKFKQMAFNNIQNSNVVRYFTSSLVEVDTYNTMSIKIVMLADQPNIVPEVDDIRVIGVSA